MAQNPSDQTQVGNLRFASRGFVLYWDTADVFGDHARPIWRCHAPQDLAIWQMAKYIAGTLGLSWGPRGLLECHAGSMTLSRAHLARRLLPWTPPKGRLRRPSCVQGWHWQTVHRTNVVATVELPYIWQLRSASHPLAVCFERAFPPSLVRGSPFGDHRSHSHTAA